jgi:hypothetical protein
MYKFSDTTKAILYANGWSEDRQVDIEEYKAYYIKTKQPVSEQIFQFLSSFGGLTVTTVLKEYPNQTVKIFSINPQIKRRAEDAKDYGEQWLMKPICHVGEAYSRDTFAMTPQGECYLMFEDFVYLIGNSITEGIETVCIGEAGIMIPPPSPDFVWR